jgi:hypothetical protein
MSPLLADTEYRLVDKTSLIEPSTVVPQPAETALHGPLKSIRFVAKFSFSDARRSETQGSLAVGCQIVRNSAKPEMPRIEDGSALVACMSAYCRIRIARWPRDRSHL